MNILFLGAGKGSWQMRGLQLAQAMAGRATSAPTPQDWQWADVAVLVKRHGLLHAPAARGNAVPVVWDALDFWAQPGENARPEAQARQGLRAHTAALRPSLTIGATLAQAAAACNGAYLPHHSWPGLVPTPARPQVRTVAYQGSPAYLGEWLGHCSRACVARGWRFVVNPPDLSQVDILVSLRAGGWDGWACREWKSGVKLVNAIAAGRPVISQATAASREILPPGSVIETPEGLASALDFWAPEDRRQRAVVACEALAPAYTLSAVAAEYSRILTARGQQACTTASPSLAV
jgi:hypothetical protein